LITQWSGHEFDSLIEQGRKNSSLRAFGNILDREAENAGRGAVAGLVERLDPVIGEAYGDMEIELT